MNKKAIALAVTLVIMAVLLTLGAVIFSRSINEKNLARRSLLSTQAFWLAEAGLNRALAELRNDFNLSDGNDKWSDTLDNGDYSVDLEEIDSDTKRVKAYGYVPSKNNSEAFYEIEAIIGKVVPSGFYDNAILTAGDLDVNGTSYSIDGNVVYADNFEGDDVNIEGTLSQDSSISPLPYFNFETLLAMSESQTDTYDSGNVYEVDENNDKLIDPDTGSEKDLPNEFWYDDAETTPNIVYIKGDLVLNGNIEAGGFFVVAGDVITDPDDTQDATLNGSGTIDGVIYTRGDFIINGGGVDGLNIDGGIWSGEETRLNGSANVAWNEYYMDAIDALNIEPLAQIIYWEDLKSPYPIQ